MGPPLQVVRDAIGLEQLTTEPPRSRYVVALNAGAWSAGLLPYERSILQLFWPILIGLAVGAAAKLIASGLGPGGLLPVALAVAGSLVTANFGQVIGLYRAGESGGHLGALLGALVAVLIYHAFMRTRR